MLSIAAAQENPSETISDEIAWTILYAVVERAPQPHWDEETCRIWLKQKLPQDLAQRVIMAATKFSRTHLKSNALTLRDDLNESLPKDSREQLSELIRDIKQHTVIRAGNRVWSYYTTVETLNTQLSATVVAGTFSDAPQTTRTAAISITSPTKRRAAAETTFDGSIGKTTVYMPLCDTICEDGNFFISTAGTSDY